MPVRVSCSCGRTLNLADALGGKKVRCPECAAAITVPAAHPSDAPTGKARPQQNSAARRPNEISTPSHGSADRPAEKPKASASPGKRTAQGQKRRPAEFSDAGAGTLNTRSVIEFVKARIPEVDPARIYTAGHSSAGTVSLLAGEYDPDVAACIAYAPCSDTEAFHADISGTFGVNRLLPGIREFDRRFSPIANVRKLKCPLFVFQARDDTIVDAGETKRFVEQARLHNPQVEYVEVDFGEHYDSMIRQGIPRALQWLKNIDAPKHNAVREMPAK